MTLHSKLNNMAKHQQPTESIENLEYKLIDLDEFELPNRCEQIWTRPVDDGLFQVCSIPFFSYGIFKNDHIAAKGRWYAQVKKKMGHRSLRIILETNDIHEDYRQRILSWVEALGLEYERWRNDNFAIDLPPSLVILPNLEFLEAEATNGKLYYEVDV